MGVTTISIEETAARKNLLLLVILRWIAVAGQLAAIVVTMTWVGIPLPLPGMGAAILFLVGLNLVSLYRYHGDANITPEEIFLELLLDVAALTVQLYLSGGATNPFVSLYLLQVILGAVLLRAWATWVIVGVTTVCYLWLMVSYQEVGLSMRVMGMGALAYFDLHVFGMFICFVLAALLSVIFITRITANLRARDARLAELRQQSVEEEHIVRMGLLASGAAHELGSPLGTLSVILNDWRRLPHVFSDADMVAELDEMRGAVARCKEIISRILVSSGEARGEDAQRSPVMAFFEHLIAEWRATRKPRYLIFSNEFGADVTIASDALLKQILFNVFDNALEASPDWVSIRIARQDAALVVIVRDKGPGFPPGILARFGKPYQSTKERPGSGLGLFLVVNVARKLGGAVTATNDPVGGAVVALTIPLAALTTDGPGDA